MAKKVQDKLVRTKNRRRTKPVGRKHSKRIGKRSVIFRKKGNQ